MCKEGERWEMTCLDNLLTAMNKRRHSLLLKMKSTIVQIVVKHSKCVFLFCIF